MRSRMGKRGKGIANVLMIFNIVVMGAVAGLLANHHINEQNKEKLEDIVMGQAEGQRNPASIAKAGEAVAPDVPSVRVYELQTFTANLANPRVPKYVRLRVEFQLDGIVQEQELERKKAQIRDEVLSILNGKRDKELLSVKGKEYLKKDILNSVNSMLVTGKVDHVLFTDFLIN